MAFGKFKTALLKIHATTIEHDEEMEIEMLKMALSKIQAALEGADGGGIVEHSEKVRLLELREVAYDAEDVIGEYEYEEIRLEVAGSRHGRMEAASGHESGKVNAKDESWSASTRSGHAFRVPVPEGLARRAKAIMERFDEITGGWEALNLPDGVAKRRRVRAWRPPATSFFVDESRVFGREEEKQDVVNFLLSMDCSTNGAAATVSVLPIVGIGGVGKTTLAQLVYNDPEVCLHFNLRAWICVSQVFSVVTLLRMIAMSFTGGNSSYLDDVEPSELLEILKRAAWGKRFLIVLDDVWNDEPKLWEPVRAPLLAAGSGAVIVTTRNHSVARIMQTAPAMVLTELCVDDSWKLFYDSAFGGLENDDVDANFVETGRKIASKCRGLPLAVKVLGGMLRGERDEETWSVVSESELWELDDGNDQILPALKLSYNHMSYHLKRCFMCLSLFPKGHALERDKIVKLWMAQGLLIQTPDSVLPESIGDIYVDDLLQRSILQEKNPERTLEMHDLIHDLAKSVADDEYSLASVDDLSAVRGSVRHLSVLLSSEDHTTLDLAASKDPKILRTLVSIYSPALWRKRLVVPAQVFLCLTRLRALDLSYADIERIPDSIGNLKQLRYLCIKHTRIESLPESACDLYNLQTLDLDMNFRKLPRGMGDLVNLRHLMWPFEGCIPRGIGRLTNLQTLFHFEVGRESYHCGVRELKGLVSLKGKLAVNWLDNASSSDVCLHETYLSNKEGLVSLDLNWSAHSSVSTEECKHRDYTTAKHGDEAYHAVLKALPPSMSKQELANRALDVLRPHTNLEELRIRFYTGSSFPGWLSDASFSRLTSLDLSYCTEVKFLPPLGRLPSLKSFGAQAMELVEYVGREFMGNDARKAFPSLFSLVFFDMPAWEQWSGLQEGDFPSLRQLTFNRCPKMKQLPGCILPSLLELEITFCNGLATLVLPDLPSLAKLVLRGRWNPELLCSSYTPMLHSLDLSYSDETSFHLPGRNLPSLKKLAVYKCSSLRSLLGFTNLTSLEVLVINSCFKLRFDPCDQLPRTIRDVKIFTCSPDLENWYQQQISKVTADEA